jgi:hypothetical protein
MKPGPGTPTSRFPRTMLASRSFVLSREPERKGRTGR